MSSISKKATMAVTGIILSGFVIVHMLGNLQIFLGQDALNSYAEHLLQTPLLVWPTRIVLLISVLLHIGIAFILTRDNVQSRPVRYCHEDTIQASYASLTMRISGVVILLFIIYHLLHFTFGKVHAENYHLLDIYDRHDVYSMVILSYRNIWVSGIYVVAMAFLCYHLSHGFFSFPQSLGFDVKKHSCLLKKFSMTLAWLIFIGNCSIPVAAYLGLLKLPGEI